jgi:hypothetical protein
MKRNSIYKTGGEVIMAAKKGGNSNKGGNKGKAGKGGNSNKGANAGKAGKGGNAGKSRKKR